jgi:hypothetical protein
MTPASVFGCLLKGQLCAPRVVGPSALSYVQPSVPSSNEGIAKPVPQLRCQTLLRMSLFMT